MEGTGRPRRGPRNYGRRRGGLSSPGGPRGAADWSRPAVIVAVRGAPGNGSGRPGNGSGRPGNGSGRHGRPGNGSRRPGNCSGSPGNGSGSPGNGSGRPGNGSGRPREAPGAAPRRRALRRPGAPLRRRGHHTPPRLCLKPRARAEPPAPASDCRQLLPYAPGAPRRAVPDRSRRSSVLPALPGASRRAPPKARPPLPLLVIASSQGPSRTPCTSL